jgi:AcrR family transcriptional regulator
MAAIGQTEPSERRQAVREFKKAAIRAATRAVLDQSGVDGVTMRAVAGASGFAPGALYAYFPNREAILADVLAQSLGNLAKAVRAACAAESDPAARLRAGANAMLAHYLGNPDDLRLLAAMKPRLAPHQGDDLDRQINGRLIASLVPLANAVTEATGLAGMAANARTVGLFTAIVGVALLAAASRLEVLGFAPDQLVEQAVADLLGK